MDDVATGGFDPAKAKKLFPAGIGHFARPNDLTGGGDPLATPFRDEKSTVALVNAIQKWQINETRLGIPTLFHEEGLHGYAARGATHFPQAIALASSWDPELLTRVGWGGTALMALGGALYSAGAAVYAFRRPDPAPEVFGYHEVFHTLVVAAAASHYAVVALWVLPGA